MFVVTVTLNDRTIETMPFRQKIEAVKLAKMLSEGNSQAKVLVSDTETFQPLCIYQRGVIIHCACNEPVSET